MFINQLHLGDPMNVDEYINFSEEKVIEEIDDDKIIESFDHVSDEENQDNTEEQIVINPGQALDAINTVISFLHQRSDDMSEIISKTKCLKEIIVNYKEKNLRQRNITDYFSQRM